MNAAAIAKLVAKQIKRLQADKPGNQYRNQKDPDLDTSSLNVEGETGLPGHLAIMDDTLPYGDKQRFNRAHQTLLQNDDGSPIFESMGMEFDRDNRMPNKQGQSPGHWVDPRSGDAVRNPTTEYRFNKTDDWRQNLAADYAGAVMGQDGVAVSDMQPGMPRGRGHASIMSPAGSGVERKLEALGQLSKRMDDVGGQPFTGPGPRVSVENGNVFAAPGSQGDIIGSTGEISAAEAMDWKKAIGEGKPSSTDMFNRPGGGDAYRGAVDYEYSSVADNVGRLVKSFEDKGMLPEFDSMIKQTASQAPRAYKKMGNIGGGAPDENFSILWEHLNANPDIPADVTIKKLIDSKTISLDEMNAIMEQFDPQQQPGLLA